MQPCALERLPLNHYSTFFQLFPTGLLNIYKSESEARAITQQRGEDAGFKGFLNSVEQLILDYYD